MSVYRMIFSPTGGTERAAELLLRPWGTEAVLIDLTDAAADYRQYHFGPEDICLAAVPSYGGRVPEIAVTRLAQMTGGGARAMLLAVYGNRAYEDTLLELKDTLTAAGFRPIAAAAAVAEHSIMRQFGAGRPDAADERMLAGFGQRIKQVLDEDDAAELRVPGSKPYRDYGGVPFTPKAGKRCTTCGLCAAKCPVGDVYKRQVLEIGFAQGPAVRALLEDAGFAGVRVIKDWQGHDRVVIGQWLGSLECEQ